MEGLTSFTSAASGIQLMQVVYSMVVTVMLTTIVAATYTWTFRGMSYTRSFVHSLVIGGIVSCTVMLAVNNNLAAGLGIAGSLAVVRFRTSVRDPRDMIFVFAAFAAGIAAGLRAHHVAVLGTLVFCGVTILTTLMDLGGQRQFDGLLRFTLPVGSSGPEKQVADIIKKTTSWFALVTVREVAQGEFVQQAYQIRLRRAGDKTVLLQHIEGVPEVSDVTLHLQDHTVEI